MGRSKRREGVRGGEGRLLSMLLWCSPPGGGEGRFLCILLGWSPRSLKLREWLYQWWEIVFFFNQYFCVSTSRKTEISCIFPLPISISFLRFYKALKSFSSPVDCFFTWHHSGQQRNRNVISELCLFCWQASLVALELKLAYQSGG